MLECCQNFFLPLFHHSITPFAKQLPHPVVDLDVRVPAVNKFVEPPLGANLADRAVELGHRDGLAGVTADADRGPMVGADQKAVQLAAFFQRLPDGATIFSSNASMASTFSLALPLWPHSSGASTWTNTKLCFSITLSAASTLPW